jgi:hypothetical protein
MTQSPLSPGSSAQGPSSPDPSSRRRFSVVAPDWGSDHLTPEAVVALVDDELARRPHERALAHVADCPQCAAEVRAQRRARSALRSATCPSLPSSLLSSLCAIPQDTELPPPPAGLAVTADGELVSVLRPAPDAPSRAAATAPHGRRPGRMRIGTGAAVSGLALGALALGAVALPAAVGPAAAPDERGVFDGAVLGGGQAARFALEQGEAGPRLLERTAHTPRTFLPDALR